MYLKLKIKDAQKNSVTWYRYLVFRSAMKIGDKTLAATMAIVNSMNLKSALKMQYA
jgi:uncharacterized membrane protein